MVKDSSNAKTESNVDDATTGEIVEVLSHLIAVGAKQLPAHAIADVETWEDALKLAQETFAHLISSEELNDGIVLIEKDTLVGVPFLVLDVKFRLSSFDDDGFYATVRGIDKNNRKFVFADGSVGIAQQLAFLADKFNQRGGFFIPNGLDRSEYETTKIIDGKEKKIQATTFYLNTQPA